MQLLRIFIIFSCPLFPLFYLILDFLEFIYLIIVYKFSYKQSVNIVFKNWEVTIIDNNENELIHEIVPNTLKIKKWLKNKIFINKNIDKIAIIRLITIYQPIATIIYIILRIYLGYPTLALEIVTLYYSFGIIALSVYECIFLVYFLMILLSMLSLVLLQSLL